MGDHADAENRAARYRAGIDDASEPEEPDTSKRGRRPEDQVLWVDHQIRQAIERGDFDDLPYEGKPLPHIDTARRPDWWLEQLIERERITGVLPEALQLRKDDAALDAELDALPYEAQVRERLEEFNARVVAARRQLQGGPPVITELRDVGAEITAWRTRRTPTRPLPSPEPESRRWWRRRT